MYNLFKSHCKLNLKIFSRLYSTLEKIPFILGIETSCDDTSLAAISINDGKLLAKSHQNQSNFHVITGGVNPIFARDLHAKNIKICLREIMEKLIDKYNEEVMDNCVALAVTCKPGLPLSLGVGVDLAKNLSSKYNIPIIPIHHMEAHALAARIEHTIDYPYLSLLVSGGHSLLVWVENVTDFKILGTSHDIAPGEAFDKLSRKLGLNYDSRFNLYSGGRSIEILSQECIKVIDPNVLPTLASLPLQHDPSCDFSFNGMLSTFSSLSNLYCSKISLNDESDVEEVKNILPNPYAKHIQNLQVTLSIILSSGINGLDQDLIHGKQEFVRALILTVFQGLVVEHLVQKTRRAMYFCERNFIEKHNQSEIDSSQLVKINKVLVIGGGVASNQHVRSALKNLCNIWGWTPIFPSLEYCTDNGTMIAWNAFEKIIHGLKRDILPLTDSNKLNNVWHDWVKMCTSESENYLTLIDRFRKVVKDLNYDKNLTIFNRSPFGLDLSSQLKASAIRAKLLNAEEKERHSSNMHNYKQNIYCT